jgi:uncharacterized protein (TIGR02246 family)
MPGTEPHDAVLEFADRLAAGDLAGAISLYEDDAVLLPDPGTVVTGRQGVRSGLGAYFALRPTLTPGARRVLVAGDVALVVHEWRLSGALPDGTALEQTGRAVDVLRRQGDGTWRFLVDNPWGTALLDHGSAPDQEVAARVCADTVSEGR